MSSSPTKDLQHQNRLRVLFVSLSFSLIITGLKWWAFYISNSVALKTDALESFINIIAIIIALTAIYQSQKPADFNHPYGHGKIEYFSAAIEGGMLLMASCYLFYEAVKSLIFIEVLREFNHALMISALAGIMNGALGFWQLKKGKAYLSEALIADAKHLLADFYTTVGIIVGLFLVKITGFAVLDPIIGAAVALLLFRNALLIIRHSAMLLSDEEDPKLIRKIVYFLNSENKPRDIVNIHMLRSFRSGDETFVDLHVVVPEFWDVRSAHDAAETFCSDIGKSLDKSCEFHPHVEGCMKKYCSHCQVENCPIRREDFKEKFVYTPRKIAAKSDEDT